MSVSLDDVLERISGMDPKARAKLREEALDRTATMKWVPNPGPQTAAYLSPADVLLYGGEPGGGKTDLLLGLAFNCHQRSLLLRRQYTNLTPLLEGAIRIHGSRDGYNGSPPPKLRINERQLIEFGAAARLGDEQAWQGNPHDFIGFDEGTQFLKQQIRFLMGWLRTTDPNQRTRVVIATNPPLTADGMFIVEMFAPWLDERHRKPAQPGELRYYITDKDGNDVEVDGPGLYETWDGVDVRSRSGEPVKALSRTFIPASVDDNPYLAKSDYRAQLDNMIEPFRSILLGKFKASLKDHPFQVIPTAWVREAQERWTHKPPEGVPMCGMGVDPAEGGKDRFTIATRNDGWYAPITCIPGKDIKLGSQGAGHVVTHRKDDAAIVIDMGGGYGGGTYTALVQNKIEPIVYKGSNKSFRRTKDRKLGFVNKRSELYWAFREALDPDQLGGSPIALPPDPELMSDLTVLTFEVTPRGIAVLEKEKVVEILGHSPDKGDSVALAWSAGPKGLIPAHGPGQYGREQYIAPPRGVPRGQNFRVDMGPRHRGGR